MLRVVTLNILIDLQLWDWRGPAIVAALKDTSPDIIALQEVHLSPNTAQWIAERLNGYQFYLAPDSGMKLGQEGLAILTRLPLASTSFWILARKTAKPRLFIFHKLGKSTPLSIHTYSGRPGIPLRDRNKPKCCWIILRGYLVISTKSYAVISMIPPYPLRLS